MKLASGDMLTFRLDSRGCVVQAIWRGDAPRVEKEGRGWNDGDSVVLRGKDVAVLLDALTTPWERVVVVEKSAGSSKLSTNQTDDAFWLETDNHAIQLTGPERYMFKVALESQVWRLFQ